MIRTFVGLLLLHVLTGCSSAPPGRPLVALLTDDESLYFAVLQRAGLGWPEELERFACVFGGDPSAGLLTALQHASTAPTWPCCHAPQPIPGSIADFGFVILTVSRVSLLDSSNAVVTARYLCGPLCAGSADYHCTRDAHGHWFVSRIVHSPEVS